MALFIVIITDIFKVASAATPPQGPYFDSEKTTD